MKVAILLLGAALLGSAAHAAAATRQDSTLPNAPARLAAIATAELKSKLPPAASTVLIVSPNAKEKGDLFAVALDQALRSAGYAVASDRRTAPSAEVVHYGVVPAFDGYLVRLTVGGAEATRLYRPNDAGALVSAGPATVREMN